jgi:pimeloyl-ACP methyl ester carboxylesterase
MPTSPPKRGRELGSAIPGATVEKVPHAGHMLMLEAADAVTKALLAFLVPQRR